MKMGKKQQFLLMAQHLTGTPKEDIVVIFFEEDEEGRLTGTVEIDGRREYIHEYHC